MLCPSLLSFIIYFFSFVSFFCPLFLYYYYLTLLQIISHFVSNTVINVSLCFKYYLTLLQALSHFVSTNVSLCFKSSLSIPLVLLIIFLPYIYYIYYIYYILLQLYIIICNNCYCIFAPISVVVSLI